MNISARAGPGWLQAFTILASVGIILALLNWAQPVLIPIALAILLTFLLTPVVEFLQRRGIGRVPSVIVVVALTLSLIAGIGWMVARQVSDLVDTFPEYRHNVRSKIQQWDPPGEDSFLEKAEKVAEDISEEINQNPQPETTVAEAETPLPVTIVEGEQSLSLPQVWPIIAPILTPLASCALALVLLIFMLGRREDLRDRAISLIGHGHLTHTTKAINDAGLRVSRYLLMQLIVNSTYGTAVAIGLYFIGIPYAALWGFFAAVLRYVPYLGPWVAALLPLALSLIVTDSWTPPVLVAAMFLCLELVSNMLVEPYLYGRGIGVSATATLVMIAFWTWLWGPFGLILATPLTVCLVVMGQYVPFLKGIDTLLGDKPALEPHLGFYQRLIARDQDEAADIVEEQMKTQTLEQVFDGVLLSALVCARRDVTQGNLSAEDRDYIASASREIAEQAVALNDAAAAETADEPEPAKAPALADKVPLLICPARTDIDEAAAAVFLNLLPVTLYEVTVTGPGSMASDLVSAAERSQPAVVCIATVPPGGMAHMRLLCMRLRARFPEMKIVVGRWGLSEEDFEGCRDALRAAGADVLCVTMTDTRIQIGNLAAITAPAKEGPPLPDHAALTAS